MGNRQNRVEPIQSLRREDWVEAGQNQLNILFANVNPYRRRLLANIVTHQLIQQYELTFIAQEDYNNYIKELVYRYDSCEDQPQSNSQSKYQRGSSSVHETNSIEKFIYPIKYFTNHSKQQMCTSIYVGFLYCEKVDLRLKEINDIPFRDLLCMYNASLRGFRLLYQKVGYFDIQEEMIFINRKGEVKVWMNANLSKNYPNFEKIQASRTSQPQVEMHFNSQAQMIKDLILLVEANRDQVEIEGNEDDSVTNRGEYKLFSTFLKQKNILQRLSFDYCIDEFQEYLLVYNLHCPEYMKSIADLFMVDDNGDRDGNTQLNGSSTKIGANANLAPTMHYQQSHVNQLTTSHVNMYNKRLPPMQMITEDNQSIYRSSKVTTVGMGMGNGSRVTQGMSSKHNLPTNMNDSRMSQSQSPSFFRTSNKAISPQMVSSGNHNHYQQQLQRQNGSTYQQHHPSYNPVNSNVSKQDSQCSSTHSNQPHYQHQQQYHHQQQQQSAHFNYNHNDQQIPHHEQFESSLVKVYRDPRQEDIQGEDRLYHKVQRQQKSHQPQPHYTSHFKASSPPLALASFRMANTKVNGNKKDNKNANYMQQAQPRPNQQKPLPSSSFSSHNQQQNHKFTSPVQPIVRSSYPDRNANPKRNPSPNNSNRRLSPSIEKANPNPNCGPRMQYGTPTKPLSHTNMPQRVSGNKPIVVRINNREYSPMSRSKSRSRINIIYGSQTNNGNSSNVNVKSGNANAPNDAMNSNNSNTKAISTTVTGTVVSSNQTTTTSKQVHQNVKQNKRQQFINTPSSPHQQLSHLQTSDDNIKVKQQTEKFNNLDSREYQSKSNDNSPQQRQRQRQNQLQKKSDITINIRQQKMGQYSNTNQQHQHQQVTNLQAIATMRTNHNQQNNRNQREIRNSDNENHQVLSQPQAQAQSQYSVSNSNLKYHSSKGSYQLDDEIAQDLEKFLGLKAN